MPQLAKGGKWVFGWCVVSLEPRAVGKGCVGAEERATLPPGTGVQPGDHLLVVRGSGLALGFLQRGPIYEEALKHPEIGMFVS